MTGTGLAVDALSVGYRAGRTTLPVLDEVSLHVGAGRTLGIVGESGSGKTTLARALGAQLSPGGEVRGGSIRLDGVEVLTLSRRDLRRWRAGNIAVVHQDAGASLDPSIRVGAQLDEVLGLQKVPRRDRPAQIRRLLSQVRLPDPDTLARRYPHELSGGQQQRVVIAAALAGRPRLLVLDEPTTGLDASVEAGILALIQQLRAELECAVVLISHDLGLVGHLCDDVVVLYAGRVVEQGAAADVIPRPRHPYTAALLAAAPRIGVPRSQRRIRAIPGRPPTPQDHPVGCRFANRCAFREDVCDTHEPPETDHDGQRVRCHFADVLAPTLAVVRDAPPPDRPVRPPADRQVLVVDDLHRSYGRRHGDVVDGVSLTVRAGEVLGLVGESGSGKSTLARSITGLGPASGSGTVSLDEATLAPRLRDRPRGVRRRLQMVFQDPNTTLNPAHPVRRVLQRALATLGGTGTVEELVQRVQLDPRLLSARSAALSGGQKQRVAIARALAGRPDLVVYDEPVSALDVSVQAGVLELLADTRDDGGGAALLISHDLAVIGYLADRVAVMYRGQIVETGDTAAVLAGPHHPYTDLLVTAAHRHAPTATEPSSSPASSPASAVVEPDPAPRATTGCRFADRCPLHIGPVCDEQPPPQLDLGHGHLALCHLPVDRLPTAAPADDAELPIPSPATDPTPERTVA